MPSGLKAEISKRSNSQIYYNNDTLIISKIEKIKPQFSRAQNVLSVTAIDGFSFRLNLSANYYNDHPLYKTKNVYQWFQIVAIVNSILESFNLKEE